MNNEKRLVLAITLMVLWMVGITYLGRMLGWNPPPKKPPAPPVAAAEAEKDQEKEKAGGGQEPAKGAVAKAEEKGKAQEPAPAAAEAKKPEVELVQESELFLGSETDTAPGGYKLRAQLTQRGAGIESLSSSRFEAEYKDGKTVKRPLQLIQLDPMTKLDPTLAARPSSLTMTLNAAADGRLPAAATEDEALAAAAIEAEDGLDLETWEVVRDRGQIKRKVRMKDPATGSEVEGEAIVFRTKAPNGVVVTKTFRLGKNIDGLEVELQFESPDRERKVVYNLLGPHSIPIEGEWYTSTFRDLVFGAINQGNVEPVTTSAYDVAKAGADKPVENTTLPLRFAGVENQYFATLLEPVPAPTGQEDRWDDRTVAIPYPRGNELAKSDVGFRIKSKPIDVAPGKPVVHTYRLYAGAKTYDALKPYGAESLATYRKNQWIPFAPYLARAVITPTLDMMYRLTKAVSGLFGGKAGNYGIAIILLTMLVRGLMFPLGRKQALAAQKMQALQPHLKAIQEKYKDDKDRLTRETFALYKKYGVNPMGGCLPALVQLPIFVGLWQALNTSVPLRHARFLWIRDLAAPDMMFPFPVEVPFLGKWFNLLPFVVIALMLVQTKLFSPPATTPEAEQSQKMMKYMMVFMGVMFYKVPAGLGIYFITSSLWALGERLLLPKLTHAELKPVESADEELEGDDRSGPKGGGNGDGRGGPRGGKGPSGTNGEGKRRGPFASFWERVLEEAQKDNSTYRKAGEERESRSREKDKGNPRPRPRRR